MNARSRSVTLGLLLSLCVAAGSATAQDAEGEFQRTVDVDGPVELDVRTGSGRIAIRPGAEDRVRIAGEIRVWSRRGGLSDDEAEELIRRLGSEPSIEVSGNRIVVGDLPDEDFRGRHGGVSISYDIEVPSETAIISRTGSGSQEIRGVRGPVEASAGSGSVTLADVGGRVIARAGSGSIRARGVTGAFDGQAGSGSIELEQVGPGDVTVSTGSGTADLRGIDGALRARAGSGRIAVQGTPRGTWDLETGSGSVRLTLPADAAFDLDARTGSGGVETSHPVTTQGRIERNRVTGQVRGGGPLLRVRTGSGGVRIE